MNICALRIGTRTALCFGVRWRRYRPRSGLAASVVLVAGALACQLVHAQQAAPAEASSLRRNEARLMLDYQTVRVQGDSPIDLMGFHVYVPVTEGVSVGAGLMGPLIAGQYGGFMGASVGIQGRFHLFGPVVALTALAVGGGAGGRSPEHAKKLSGTGSFLRGQLALGYDAGDFMVGAGTSSIKFRRSLIDSSQLNLFLDIPFSYLSGSYGQRGQPLSDADAEALAGGEGDGRNHAELLA